MAIPRWKNKNKIVLELSTSVVYWGTWATALWQRSNICKCLCVSAWSDLPATRKTEARKASSLYCQGRIEGLDASQMAAEYAQPTASCWNTSQSPATSIFRVYLGIEGWGMAPRCAQLAVFTLNRIHLLPIQMAAKFLRFNLLFPELITRKFSFYKRKKKKKSNS